MKKMFLASLMLALSSVCFAQNNGMFVTLRVTDSIWLNGSWVKRFSDDSTMGTGSAGVVPTEKAIKGALANLPAASSTSSGNVTTGFQQFAGSKEFLDGVTVDNMPAQSDAASLFVTSNGGVLNTRTAMEVRDDILAAPASGSGSYIWNQNADAQAGGIWITNKIKTSDTVQAKVFSMNGPNGANIYLFQSGTGPGATPTINTSGALAFSMNGSQIIAMNGIGITQTSGKMAAFSLLTGQTFGTSITTITADFDLTSNFFTTIVNRATTGNPVITLPGNTGRVVNIVNAPSNAGNYCTWTPAAKLNDGTSVSSFNDAALGGTTHVTLQNDGSNWWVIAH